MVFLTVLSCVQLAVEHLAKNEQKLLESKRRALAISIAQGRKRRVGVVISAVTLSVLIETLLALTGFRKPEYLTGFASFQYLLFF